MDMRLKRFLVLALTAGMVFLLSGCRTRTTGNSAGDAISVAATGAADASESGGSVSDISHFSAASETDGDLQSDNSEISGQTKENPEAQRKEYDENASAEIVPGTSRLIHTEGEGNGASAVNEDAALSASHLNNMADETATQTVSAKEADRTGVSEDAEEAESAMTYYTVLLQDRMGSLYECQRANVYWETAQDHVTIHKTSPEHELILNAGAYDVSARLLQENLKVTDGWVARKNPQVIVKAVDTSILGGAVSGTGAAETVYHNLLSRDSWSAIDAVRNHRILLISGELLDAPYLQTAAMLMIAKVSAPELLADVDIDKALSMLMEEATGTLPTGIYYYITDK